MANNITINYICLYAHDALILRLDAMQQYVILLFCSIKFNICNDDNINRSSVIGYSALVVDQDSKNMNRVFTRAAQLMCVCE